MDKKSFIKELEVRGYHEFDSPCLPKYDMIESCFQKRFDDEKGKKYFIEAYIYKDFEFPVTGDVLFGEVEFETQLYDKERDAPINLKLFSGWDIEAAEDRVEKIFQTGMFRYYEEF